MPLSSSPPERTARRNLTLELCKLIAACFVVFIHVPFPAPAGEWVLCLARFAVPMFFAISGWYSYGAAPNKLLHRMVRVLALELVGIAISLLFRAISAVYTGWDPIQALLSALPGREAMKLWLLLSDDPFSGHLWYLSASAFSYGILWLYTRSGCRKWGYIPLYVLGAILLAAHFAMGELCRYTGLRVLFKIPRSGFFFGLPMFLMGMFLRQYRDRLLRKGNTPALVLLLVLGTGMSLAEWKFFGVYDLYMGLLISVPAVLLLTGRHPGVPRGLEKAAALCGSISTGIYLIHITVRDGYQAFFQWRLEPHMGASEPWLQPLIILFVSLAAAALWKCLVSCCSCLFVQRKKE